MAKGKVESRPDRVRLLRPFGYIDAQGIHHFWYQDSVVADVAVIALLRSRGAALEEVESC